jgi:N-acetyl-gamma-glutamylphosphate reductase
MNTTPTAHPLRIAIVGASGYSGGELLRLLASDPTVRIELVTARAQAGKPVEDVHPFLAGRVPLTFVPFDPAAVAGMDCVFIALPSGEAMQIVPSLQGKVGCIIDLGGDLRLPTAALYEQYYKKPHTSPHLLGTAVYGLPELNREPRVLPDQRHPGSDAFPCGRTHQARRDRCEFALRGIRCRTKCLRGNEFFRSE